jgi:hypothetical protein
VGGVRHVVKHKLVVAIQPHSGGLEEDVEGPWTYGLLDVRAFAEESWTYNCRSLKG